MSVEIKVGQRWIRKTGEESEITCVTEKYVFYVFFDEEGEEKFANGESKETFLGYYKLKPEPKTRYITEADIRKMLAVNPVLWRRLMTSATTFCDWELMTSTEFYPVGQYSHNPFAPNPVIVGPEIEVVE